MLAPSATRTTPRPGPSRLTRSGTSAADSASLYVDGIPARFTCSGCGAHGDVIDVVQRFRVASFVEAVAFLESGRLGDAPAVDRRIAASADRAAPRQFVVSDRRVHYTNEQAWRVFSAPRPPRMPRRASSGPLHATALHEIEGDKPLAGYAAPG